MLLKIVQLAVMLEKSLGFQLPYIGISLNEALGEECSVSLFFNVDSDFCGPQYQRR